MTEADSAEQEPKPHSICVLRGATYMEPFCFYPKTTSEVSSSFIPVAVPTLVSVIVSVVGRGNLCPNTMVRASLCLRKLTTMRIDSVYALISDIVCSCMHLRRRIERSLSATTSGAAQLWVERSRYEAGRALPLGLMLSMTNVPARLLVSSARVRWLRDVGGLRSTQGGLPRGRLLLVRVAATPLPRAKEPVGLERGVRVGEASAGQDAASRASRGPCVNEWRRRTSWGRSTGNEDIYTTGTPTKGDHQKKNATVIAARPLQPPLASIAPSC